ncbi:MAG: RNA polymerase sigma factor [Thermoleophilaceae bacterium]
MKETSNGAFDRCSDPDLLALTRDKPEAFGVFYERHVDAILRYLSRQTGSSGVALDLTAEVFAAALAGSHRYRPERGPARAWLFGIANNKLAASRRRDALDLAARRKLGVRLFEFSDEALERVEEIVDAAGSGYVDGLKDLPESERAAIVARVLEEQEYADIAAAADVSEAAIRQRVSRGLAKLAALRRRG